MSDLTQVSELMGLRSPAILELRSCEIGCRRRVLCPVTVVIAVVARLGAQLAHLRLLTFGSMCLRRMASGDQFVVRLGVDLGMP